MTKFFQIKEWLDPRVARIQGTRTPQGNQILVVDLNNINVIPFPPVFPGTTINSIRLDIDATP